MSLSLEHAYNILKDSPQMTQAVGSNNASPYQGIATLAQQYHNQANKKEIPMPMQSVLQQQNQPTTFAKGDKVKSKAKSPAHAIDLQIAKQFGTNIPPKLKAILKAGAAHTIATGKPDPGHLRAVLREASKLPPEIQAKFAPQFAAAKAALAKAKGVAGISKFAEGDTVEAKPAEEDFTDSPGKFGRDIEELASLFAKPKISSEMGQMMQMAQEGKQRQGLASVIGAALTGAATPHALQAGQNSAMMAGEAADKGIASLQAGQDAMMGKAAEIEGGEAAAHNQALAALLASQMEDKKYKAALASAGLRGHTSETVAQMKIEAAAEAAELLRKEKIAMEGTKFEHKKELQEALIASKEGIAQANNDLRAIIDKAKSARVDKLTGAQQETAIHGLTAEAQKAFANNGLTAIRTFPVQDYSNAIRYGEIFDNDAYMKDGSAYLTELRQKIASKTAE